MFSQLTAGLSAILVGLAGIWLIAYIVGMVKGQPVADRSRRLARWAKLTMIGVALAYGGIWWRLSLARTGFRTVALLLFVGLLIGAIGDLILADLFEIKRPEIAAMAVFGIGHIVYIVAILILRTALGLRGMTGPLIAVILAGALLAGIWRLAVYRQGGSRVLNIGSLVYGLLLSATVALAGELALQAPGISILAIGLFLFLLSDLLLAQYLIRKVVLFPYIRDAVWFIYSIAQVIIAFAIGTTGSLLS